MIALDLATIAAVTGGTMGAGSDPETLVTAPATVDSRQVETGGLFVAIAGEHADGHDFAAAAHEAGAAAVLASQPVSAPHVLVADATIALGRLARHVVDALDVTVIGVTGSQGKTSVKDLLAHVLEGTGPTIAPAGSFNNELGVPLTVLRADRDTRFLIVEMGARGIGHIATLCEIAPPDVGMVLNVGSAHLGEFGTVDDTARAKGELVEALRPDGVAVLNADDPRVNQMALRTSARVLTFGTTGNVRLEDVHLDDAGEPHFVVEHAGERVAMHVPQLGEHHAVNAAAVAAAATAVGVDLHAIAARLATAGPRSPHRMARHVRADGLVVIDDTYNANPESTAAALRALAATGSGQRVALLGEMLELGPTSYEQHVAIGRLAAGLGIERIVAVGPGAAGVAEGAGDRGELAADVAVAIDTLSASLDGSQVVLVKASRGARLERVVHALLGE